MYEVEVGMTYMVVLWYNIIEALILNHLYARIIDISVIRVCTLVFQYPYEN